MTTRLTPAPMSGALGAGRTRPGNAGDVASATPECTTTMPPGLSPVALWDLAYEAAPAGTLIDPHVSPVLACAECLLPGGGCHCT